MKHLISWTRNLLACCAVALTLVAATHLADAQTTRESKVEVKALEKKVDDVLANQRVILQKLDAVMEELRIVKVRATHS